MIPSSTHTLDSKYHSNCKTPEYPGEMPGSESGAETGEGEPGTLLGARGWASKAEAH